MFEFNRGRPAATVPLRTLPTPPPLPSARQLLYRLRCEWRRVARVLSDPAVELDADEFLSAMRVYQRLKAIGATIDPMAEALILQGMYRLASIEACLDG